MDRDAAVAVTVERAPRERGVVADVPDGELVTLGAVPEAATRIGADASPAA